MQINYLDFLLVVLILITPIISGVIIYKLYNVIQGIITFLTTNYILYFISNNLIDTKNFLNDEQLSLIINVTFIPYNLIFEGISLLPNIDKYIVKNEQYIMLSIVILIYLSSQLISITIKRLRN